MYRGAWKKAQSVKCLPYTYEDLSLDPQWDPKCGGSHLQSQLCGGRDRRIQGVCWPVSKYNVVSTFDLQ